MTSPAKGRNVRSEWEEEHGIFTKRSRNTGDPGYADYLQQQGDVSHSLMMHVQRKLLPAMTAWKLCAVIPAPSRASVPMDLHLLWLFRQRICSLFVNSITSRISPRLSGRFFPPPLFSVTAGSTIIWVRTLMLPSN